MDSQSASGFPAPKSKAPLVAIVLGILLVASLIFGFVELNQANTNKSNLNKKIAVAVSLAQNQQKANDQLKFDEQSKSPYKTFQGSATYGTISFSYPKSWSAYVDTSSSDTPINGYFSTGEVPGISSGATYQLRVELVTDDYSSVVSEMNDRITSGKLKAIAYIPPKLKGVANVQPGTRFDGEIGQTDSGVKNGAMVVIKVRDKTLKISTESQAGLADFNNIILPSLTFVP